MGSSNQVLETPSDEDNHINPRQIDAAAEPDRSHDEFSSAYSCIQRSHDPNDFPALTPAHLLIGRPLVAVPDNELADSADLSLVRKFQQRQDAMNFFWKRWCKDFLTLLQQ